MYYIFYRIFILFLSYVIYIFYLFNRFSLLIFFCRIFVEEIQGMISRTRRAVNVRHVPADVTTVCAVCFANISYFYNLNCIPSIYNNHSSLLQFDKLTKRCIHFVIIKSQYNIKIRILIFWADWNTCE